MSIISLWSMKTVTHIDKGHSASTKINPSSTPKSGNLKWIKNGCKSNSQGYGKSKMAVWLFLAPWQTSLSFDGIKPFLAAELMLLQWKKMFKMCLPLGYMFYNLQCSRHPLHWTNHTSINKKLNKLLKNYHCHCHPQSSGKDNRTKINYIGLNKLLNMIIIFMTFCLPYHWLLIFVFRYKEALPLKLLVV